MVKKKRAQEEYQLGGSIVSLNDVIYDVRARDGTWCTRPYVGYPNGCPNFVKGCTSSRPDFMDLKGYTWNAVIWGFNIAKWEHNQKKKWPTWTRKQCRNPRHWQGGVMSRLLEYAQTHYNALIGDIILDIPEATGINVLSTIAKAGVFIKMKDPDIIQKVMFVGKQLSKHGPTRSR